MDQKKSLFLLSISILFVLCLNTLKASNVTLPIAQDGAWSLNSQPSSVYHEGVVYMSWITKSGNLMISSYNQITDEVKTSVVASGFGTEDFASPSILVRASGQLLVFASKNTTESGFQCYRSNSTNGEFSEGFSVQTMTGYGINATTAYSLGENIIIFWRSKNNLGYTFVAGANGANSTGALAAGTRAGFLNTGIANNYHFRDEVPFMRTFKAPDGSIHAVITQLGTGLFYNSSTIHYAKIVNNNNTGILFQKADGTSITSFNYATPPDVIFATSTANEKVIAYDITLIDNKPAVLYDLFNAENVNAPNNPGTSSNHTYKIAKWTGNSWSSYSIDNVNHGIPTSEYKAVGGRTFRANTYQAGGMCFDVNNPNVIYLSKIGNGANSFDIYKFQTNDNALNWTELERITQSNDPNIYNMRPLQVTNSPQNRVVELLWMQGEYVNPSKYNTSIISRGKSKPVTAINFEKSKYYVVINDVFELKPKFSPLFVDNQDVVFESEDIGVVEILSNGQLKAVSAGVANIIARAVSNNLVITSCEVYVEARPVFDVFMERIVNEAFADRILDVTKLDENVDQLLTQLQSNGSFLDVNYTSTDRTNWSPLLHLDRMIDMALAYTYPHSAYFKNVALKDKLDLMLSYWQSQAPNSTNWYQNEIAEPQRMGLFLILMQYAGELKTPTNLFETAVMRMRNKGGNPGAQAGANRVDVALHWLYRSCLLSDRDLLESAMEYIYSPIAYTSSSEGIQHDNSFTQHGRQLHIGSYGEVFLNGITRAAAYAVNTQYSLPNEKLSILSRLIKDTYLSVFRGDNIFFNVLGRASTRPNATKKTGENKIVKRMSLIDSEFAQHYNWANERFSNAQPASYQVASKANHFYNTDYSIHQRPNYSVDLRMVSTRTVRNEYLKDNFEGKNQYFLSDGAMGIFSKGNEYHDIFPVWNWAKIPGVTCPEFSTIPQLATYIKLGQSNFVGGVTDSLNMVSVYQYNDTEFGINTRANKSWFFFDKEIVCLGSSINSSSPLKINTTLNQVLRDGEIRVSANGLQTAFDSESATFNQTLDWAYHGGVLYHFPQRSKVQLNAQAQHGSWFDINGNYSENVLSKNVFTLSIDHGIAPQSEKYAYTIIPDLNSVADVQSVDLENIVIVLNSDTLQIVHSKRDNAFGFVFYKAGAYRTHGITVEVDAPCVLLIKDVDLHNTTVHVADPSSGTNPINIGISTTNIPTRRLITYHAQAPNLGQTKKFVINEETALYKGRDILHNRSEWLITTSINGVFDEAIYGDQPNYIIDEDTRSAFVFVKPGRTFGGLTAPIDYVPSFTIDMQQSHDISFFKYRHRTYNNTTEPLRAKNITFEGKNNIEDNFVTLLNNIEIPTNIDEVKINLSENVSYRYVRLIITNWDNMTGNTIQVSDFNLGFFGMTNFDDINTNATFDFSTKFALYPNPIKKGDIIKINLQGFEKDFIVSVYSTQGRLLKSDSAMELDSNNFDKGMYILKITQKSTNQKFSTKFVVL